MNATELVAKYRKHAGALRRLGYSTFDLAASRRAQDTFDAHCAGASSALAGLRELGLNEVEDWLREERRLLDSARLCAEFEPNRAARYRSSAKQHQYRVGQLIKGK